MRYILSGQYADGSEYGEAVDNLADLAFITSDIDRFDGDERIDEAQRVDAETVTIETEEA